MQWLILILFIPYVFLLLRIFISLNKIKPYSSSEPPSVFVSVIIACRNEEKNLPSLLNDLSEQDYDPSLYEVIIIDDNSLDMTFGAASGYKGIKNLLVYKNSGTGKKKAIRTGIGTSSGSLIITTDADCRLKKSWISTIASFYEKKNPQMIICPVILKGESGFFHRFQELEFLSLQGITAGTAVAGNPVMCNGSNLSFTKESYNGHTENLHYELISGDDIFLLHSIKKEFPGKILWLESENAVVSTPSSETFGSFMRQRARWISKAGVYKDRYTRIIAIATLMTSILQLFAFMAVIFSPHFLLLFLAVFMLKSFPDFMILRNTTVRYGKKNLMKWFIISQFVYPFYIITVLFSLLRLKTRDPNFPYLTGT